MKTVVKEKRKTLIYRYRTTLVVLLIAILASFTISFAVSKVFISQLEAEKNRDLATLLVQVLEADNSFLNQGFFNRLNGDRRSRVIYSYISVDGWQVILPPPNITGADHKTHIVVNDEEGEPEGILTVRQRLFYSNRIMNIYIYLAITLAILIVLIGFSVVSSMASKKALEEQQKFFTANVSHELRTPVTAISSYAKLILSNEDTEMRRKGLLSISMQSERLIHMIDNLLLLSKINADKKALVKERLPLSDFIYSVVAELSDIIERAGAQIIINIDNALVLQANLTLAEEAVANILINAVNYVPKPCIITVNGRAVRNGIEIEISDNGPGIAKHHIKQIFERFYRGEREAGGPHGSGLGLAIVYDIMKAHGGAIKAANLKAGGASFVLFFPDS
jgi:signal transduction histidine kinase